MPGSVSSFSIPGSEQLSAVDIEPAALEAFDIVGFNSRDIRSRPFNLLRQLVKQAKPGLVPSLARELPEDTAGPAAAGGPAAERAGHGRRR